MAVNTAQYAAQRRGVNDDFAAKSAANAYSRTLSARAGAQSVGDLSKRFGRGLPRLQAGLGSRGLSGPGVRSGVAQGALQRYVGDHTQSMGRLQQDVTDQSRQYQLGQASLEAQRSRALADIEAQKQNEIALAALNIKAIQPLIGGY